jgi:NADPH:quinone reductase-like Zn-dependent oxidoreductase
MEIYILTQEGYFMSLFSSSKQKDTMRAVVLTKPTPARDICLSELPIPTVRPGWVLVKVMAFGMNHSEQILRQTEILADYIQKPIVPGIECVGQIADPSDSGLAPGQTVIAMMGGMGRSFSGSYAAYALLPAHHVFPVETGLSWEALAAVPETYYTAWGSLFSSLHLESGEALLVRGATCALGYAAIQLAKALGCTVVATTHRPEKLGLLQAADQAVLDTGALAGTLPPVNKALELVGPKTLRDTLRCVAPGGIVCNTGILGGVFALNGFDPIKDIPNSVYLTGFFSNTPTQAVVDDLFAFLGHHDLTPLYGKAFSFDRIQEAIQAQDNGSVEGKIVVTL